MDGPAPWPGVSCFIGTSNTKGKPKPRNDLAGLVRARPLPIHLLERVPFWLNWERALDSLFGRIFCGKAVSTFPENALATSPESLALRQRPCGACRNGTC